MSVENLIPSPKPPFTKEQQSKGGKSKSEVKRRQSLINTSKIAKCKNCKVDCIYKENNLKKNNDIICSVPRSRATAIFEKIPITEFDEHQLKACVDELLRFSQEQFMDNPTREVGRFIFRLIQVKDKFYPAVQKSVEVQVNFETLYKQWEERVDKEIKEGKEIKAVIVDDSD